MLFSSPRLYSMIVLLPFSLLFMFLQTACSNDAEDDKRKKTRSTCIECHQVELDDAHAFSCSTCHGGDETRKTKEAAHLDLVVHPAHPNQAKISCGPCHAESVTTVKKNPHYMLPSYTAAMKTVSGSKEVLTVDTISSFAEPTSGQDLLQDALKRKCLRCHVYHNGDDFPLTRRATGCGACHLKYYDGTMTSHRFIKHPKDSGCLSCHYGNRVGFDYYGRFEHDLNEEYRTPYTTREDFFRPYGLEYHNLAPDLHQRAGMVCIDCHYQEQLMGNTGERADCRSCHDPEVLHPRSSTMIEVGNNNYVFTSKATGKTFTIPLMKHPAHQQFKGQFSCQACHAQWSFNDRQTHLLRIDHDDFDEFERLTRDGDSHTRRILFSNIDFDSVTLETSTKDYLTGESLPGIWLQGYLERRWETFNLITSSDGVLTVSRPILDLSLSWIDSDETVRFDNFKPFGPLDTARPYAPHTIGNAGAFFMQRLSPFLKDRVSHSPDTPMQNN